MPPRRFLQRPKQKDGSVFGGKDEKRIRIESVSVNKSQFELTNMNEILAFFKTSGQTLKFEKKGIIMGVKIERGAAKSPR